jgi:hypothetical protein
VKYLPYKKGTSLIENPFIAAITGAFVGYFGDWTWGFFLILLYAVNNTLPISREKQRSRLRSAALALPILAVTAVLLLNWHPR